LVALQLFSLEAIQIFIADSFAASLALLAQLQLSRFFISFGSVLLGIFLALCGLALLLKASQILQLFPCSFL